MSGYTEDHLVEQPAIQFMRDELGFVLFAIKHQLSTISLLTDPSARI